jgi:integrase
MRVFRPTYRDRKTNQTKQVGKWWVEIRDHSEIVRRFPGFKDKAATADFGRQIERLIATRVSGEQPNVNLTRWLESVPAKLRERFVKVGLLDGSRAATNKPLTEHLQDFQEFLLAKGNTLKQAKMTASRVRRIIDGCGLRTWTDVSASKTEIYLAGLRDKGLGKATSNHYLKALQHFGHWMVQDGRAVVSPVEYLKPISVSKSDKRRIRRPLEPDEIRCLLETTAVSKPRFGLTGHERTLLYRLACESGLRANELRQLKVGSFDFDRCIVRVEDRDAKNRQEAILPLRPDTAAELKDLFANKMPQAQAFKVPDKPIKLLRPDLEAAGILYQDKAGRCADFHSLRHTTGTLLAAAGVHPKTAQAIMRHADVRLTMNVYTHTLRGQEAEAVAKLPDFSLPRKGSQQNLKTGTDDRHVAQNDLAENLAFLGASLCTHQRNHMHNNGVFDSENGIFQRARQDSNLQPSDSKSATLSN